MVKCIYFLIISSLLTACTPKDIPDCGFLKDIYGDRITWKHLPIVIYIDQDFPVDKRVSIYNAAKAWEKAIGKTLFDIRENKYNGNYHDNINVISYLTEWETRPQNATGLTSTYYVNNEIMEADIGINREWYTFSNHNEYIPMSFKLEPLMKHELGHLLGLQHRTDDAQSIMNPYSYRGAEPDIIKSDADNAKCGYEGI